MCKLSLLYLQNDKTIIILIEHKCRLPVDIDDVDWWGQGGDIFDNGGVFIVLIFISYVLNFM